jgi:hypothetical protein
MVLCDNARILQSRVSGGVADTPASKSLQTGSVLFNAHNSVLYRH